MESPPVLVAQLDFAGRARRFVSNERNVVKNCNVRLILSGEVGPKGLSLVQLSAGRWESGTTESGFSHE